ncbi:MAG: HRDC domain-containing protein [bacterium]|nr:HRDC domain-containing protein [bacterium]
MTVRIITIPFDRERGIFPEEELNRFCAARQVLHKRPEFFSHQGRAWWTVWLEVEEVEPGQSIPEGLNAAQAGILKRLREWRMQVADKAGLPAYVVLTNRELEEVARRKPGTLEALRGIHGLGQKKLARYGKAILALVSETGPPTLEVTQAMDREPPAEAEPPAATETAEHA